MTTRQSLLATMITSTTYGTWLPGDLRGYVDDGVILPGDPTLWERARGRMVGEPVLLTTNEQDMAFEALVAAADEFGYRLLAVSIESWHMHVLLSHGLDTVAVAAGRLKTRVRQTIGRGRVWTAGYDKRYCFREDVVEARRDYIRRHRGHRSIG
jgi:hypothetical protein